MQRHFWLPFLALILTLTPSWAEETYKQIRVNITIRVPSFEFAAADLREVVSQFDGHIQNMNLDHKGTNGSANVKVTNAKVSELVKQLSELGKIENQNQSTNDNTNSIRNYSRKARAYKALSELDLRTSFAKLPNDIRGEVQADYENWVNNRRTSNENSVRQYKESSGQAEIHIQFKKDSEPESHPAHDAQVDQPSPDQGKPAQAPQAPAPSKESPAVYILCLVNFLGLWLIYRRVDANETTSTPHGIND